MIIKKVNEIQIDSLKEPLTAARKAAGLTVADVCRRAGISRETWYSVVNAAENDVVTIEVLASICAALSKSPSDFGINFISDDESLSTSTEGLITIGPMSYDCSQREMVIDIANRIYRMMGYDATDKGLMYFFDSQHPTEQAVLSTAEDIFEIFWGDTPDYDDEDDE